MQNVWEWENTDGIKYLTLPGWKARGVNLCFSTRHGGVSASPFNYLNQSIQVGDIQQDVLTNRVEFMNAIGAELRNVVCCQQINGHGVSVVGKMDRGRGAIHYNDAIPICDGVITNVPGVILMSLVADCLPIFYFDPIKRVIGVAHCGPNGTMEQIVGEMAKKMVQVYHCRYKDIEVFIGPGLGKCCSLIDENTAKSLLEVYPHFDDIISKTENGLNWDMVSTNRQLLQTRGIYTENISTCGLCTSCEEDHFFSMARDGVTGRMAAVISLDK